LNPSTTLAILVGASAWPRSRGVLPESEAFSNSARELASYVLSSRGLALPQANLLNLFDSDAAPSELLDQVSTFLQERKDSAKVARLPAPTDLLVYYTGHGGFTGQDRSYFLAVRTTKTQTPGASSIRMVDLASILKTEVPDVRRYIILDCCFSAAAYSDYQAAPAEAARIQTLESFPTRGTSLLCSSSRRSVSIADDGRGHTMFSGALLDVLRKGNDNVQDPFLSLEQVGASVCQVIRDKYPNDGVRPEVLSPDQREGNIAHLPLFPNAALTGSANAVKRLPLERLNVRQRTDWRRVFLIYWPTQPRAWFPHILSFVWCLLTCIVTFAGVVLHELNIPLVLLSDLFFGCIVLVCRAWAITAEYYPVSNHRHARWRWLLLLYVPIHRNGVVVHFLFWAVCIFGALTVKSGFDEDGLVAAAATAVLVLLIVLAIRGWAQRFECVSNLTPGAYSPPPAPEPGRWWWRRRMRLPLFATLTMLILFVSTFNVSPTHILHRLRGWPSDLFFHFHVREPFLRLLHFEEANLESASTNFRDASDASRWAVSGGEWGFQLVDPIGDRFFRPLVMKGTGLAMPAEPNLMSSTFYDFSTAFQFRLTDEAREFEWYFRLWPYHDFLRKRLPGWKKGYLFRFKRGPAPKQQLFLTAYYCEGRGSSDSWRCDEELNPSDEELLPLDECQDGHASAFQVNALASERDFVFSVITVRTHRPPTPGVTDPCKTNPEFHKKVSDKSRRSSYGTIAFAGSGPLAAAQLEFFSRGPVADLPIWAEH
jgi:hypothetical protein